MHIFIYSTRKKQTEGDGILIEYVLTKLSTFNNTFDNAPHSSDVLATWFDKSWAERAHIDWPTHEIQIIFSQPIKRRATDGSVATNVATEYEPILIQSRL